VASRRTFLKFGLSACAPGAIAISQQSNTPRPISSQVDVVPYRTVFDERFEVPRAFAACAAQRRIAVAAIRGDITSLFFYDLDLRWKRGPVVLAGYTTPASLFCLDLLARDRGMRVSHCEAGPRVETALGVLDAALPRRRRTTPLLSTDPDSLVFWIIEPSVRADRSLTVAALI